MKDIPKSFVCTNDVRFSIHNELDNFLDKVLQHLRAHFFFTGVCVIQVHVRKAVANKRMTSIILSQFCIELNLKH